jgi:hypothetical protein
VRDHNSMMVYIILRTLLTHAWRSKKIQRANSQANACHAAAVAKFENVTIIIAARSGVCFNVAATTHTKHDLKMRSRGFLEQSARFGDVNLTSV